MADNYFESTVEQGFRAYFDVLYEIGGGSRSLKGAGAISVRLLPYGPPPNAVVQSAGGMPLIRTYRLRFESTSEMDNLWHCRGHHGTLHIGEGDFDCTFQDATSGLIEFDLQAQEAVANFVDDNV